MKIYLVGGAVRDKLLGLPVKEKDYVVVGATAEDMLKLGYRQVGKEFPVFLHPKTSEEYALARMEKKVEPGYQGFNFDTSPDVSLKDDLIRRDLTINAMAEDQEGKLYDFYQGKEDLEQRILRHVSLAFAEDPVRILRVGRFLARYYYFGFRVADDTNELMRKMVSAGEVDALVAERVWKELDRTLLEKNPEKFFEVLANCGALGKLFPGLELNGDGMKALKAAAEFSQDAAVRFAALMSGYELAKAMDICDRYRAPNEYRELVRLVIKLSPIAINAKKLSAEELLDLFAALDIFRREERFGKFLLVCKAITSDFPLEWLQQGAGAAKSFNVHELLSKGLKGEELVTELKKKRIERIADWKKK
jgi:tRNA nucleotidyltransferase (CCA-adding enzyme)